jgi:ribose 1,5-bisphosphokinase
MIEAIMIAKGVLGLVVGPSGAGKDTLIAAARDRLAHEPSFHFCKRIITRVSDAQSEVHDSLGLQEFLEAEQAGRFFLSWRTHGLHYALSSSASDALHDDCVVIANVSRSVIAAAECAVRNVVVFSITAPAHVLTDRLTKRGRDSIDEIQSRLQREQPITTTRAPIVEIDNAGAPSNAANDLIRRLRGLSRCRSLTETAQ